MDAKARRARHSFTTACRPRVARFALERGSDVVGVLAVVCFASLFAILVAMAMQAPSMAILKHSNGVFHVGRMKRAFTVRLGA